MNTVVYIKKDCTNERRFRPWNREVKEDREVESDFGKTKAEIELKTAASAPMTASVATLRILATQCEREEDTSTFS